MALGWFAIGVYDTSPLACCVQFSRHLIEDRTMHPADFADDETLYLTLAGMIYDRLRKSPDPAREKALNPYGLVLPFEQRSASFRFVWETVCKEALLSMGIIGSGSVNGLRVRTKPAADELPNDEEAIF
jgi:hypothetical protein